MKNTEIENIIIRYLASEATEKEKIFLLEWLRKSDANKTFFFEIKSIYELRSLKHIAKQSNSIWTNLNKSINKSHKYIFPFVSKRTIATLAIAASVLAFVFTGLRFYSRSSDEIINETLATYMEMETPVGSMVTFTLIDGSEVELYGGSKLKYPSTLQGGELKVYLEGEARFQVNKKVQRVFKVETSTQNIEVLGTTFYVNDFKLRKSSQVILAEGSLNLTNTLNNESRQMKPCDIVKLDKISMRSTYNQINSELALAIKDKEYPLQEKKFGELMNDLSLLFGVHIELKNTQLSHLIFSGKLSLDKNIEDIINILNYKKQFNFKRTADDKIVIF